MTTGAASSGRGASSRRRDLLTHRALSGRSRLEILETLRQAGPLDARGIAGRVGLHHNTVRSHLEVLGEAGLVERHPEPRGTPGRPRMLYRAIRHTREGRYELLSKILAVFVAGTSADVGSAMDRAGRTWGRMLARADGDASHGRQVARLLALLDELGFEPELGPARAGGDRDVVLHACPFLEVAKERPDVVCSVHLGIMRGALGELGGLVEATGLDPFVEPDRCVAHLAGLDDGDGEIALEGVSAEVDP